MPDKICTDSPWKRLLNEAEIGLVRPNLRRMMMILIMRMTKTTDSPNPMIQL